MKVTKWGIFCLKKYFFPLWLYSVNFEGLAKLYYGKVKPWYQPEKFISFSIPLAKHGRNIIDQTCTFVIISKTSTLGDCKASRACYMRET